MFFQKKVTVPHFQQIRDNENCRSEYFLRNTAIHDFNSRLFFYLFFTMLVEKKYFQLYYFYNFFFFNNSVLLFNK